MGKRKEDINDVSRSVSAGESAESADEQIVKCLVKPGEQSSIFVERFETEDQSSSPSAVDEGSFPSSVRLGEQSSIPGAVGEKISKKKVTEKASKNGRQATQKSEDRGLSQMMQTPPPLL